MNFVFDIDGTLCFDGKTIELDIQEAIEELIISGHKVIFASARPIRDLRAVLPGKFFHLQLIGGNGAFTSFEGRIESVSFDEDTKNKLYSLIEKYNCTYLADSDWDFAYTGEQGHPIYHHINQVDARNIQLKELNNLCKLVLFNVGNSLLKELATLPVSITRYKSEDIFDISPHGINKVRGIHYLGIRDFIAFGNDQNDKCLFEQAVHSVCVGNQDVKKYASEVISKEDVAKRIRNFLRQDEQQSGAFLK